MTTKISILGSTGSIGKTCLKIIARDKKNFKIELLSAKKNYKLLLKQAKEFNVKNIIITDNKSYNIAKLKKNFSVKIYNNFDDLKKIFPKKIDYVMSSIVGLQGLPPTLKIIKFTKKIAIANKESIICGWNLINKELHKNNTEFIPVDSEHFSIWYALRNNLNKNIQKIYLTASGGSLLNVKKSQFNKLKINDILKHPNWNMGKKITIDSSTLMNKVFEVIEAKNIFNLDYKKIKIIIHPQSFIHAIIQFSDGMLKIIAHETTMDIPIRNTIYNNQNRNFKYKNLNFNKLNNVKFLKVNTQKYPYVKIINRLPKTSSLYETVLVTANDEFVRLFLDKKIKYSDIINKTLRIINRKEFTKLKKILPRNVSEVITISKIVKDRIKSIN
jgi:1-deoxy-D-xylulose-5-phosphate reductoisomerase